MGSLSDPALTLAEHLSKEFYDWERRGRGWVLWDSPVLLEPPFRPFFHTIPLRSGIRDDARRPGILERILDHVRGNVTERTTDDSVGVPGGEDLDAETPDEDEDERDLIELQIRLPPSLDVSRELAERMLLAVGGAAEPVAFELIGVSGRVVLQFTCDSEDASGVRQALDSFVPEATVQEAPRFLREAWSAREGGQTVVAEFGLSREFMLPLDVPRSFAVDPLLAFTSSLEGVRNHEIAVFQVLFTRTAYPWADSIARAMTDGDGGAFFADAPGTLAQAREKISRPLFACVLRVGTMAETEARAWRLAREVGNALTQFTDPSANEFLPLENDGYRDVDHAADLIERRTRRSGMILATDELASIVHLPSPSVRSAGLRGSPRTTKAAPAHLAFGDVVLGENTDRGKTSVVRLSSSMRLRHMHVIGATGSGKSTLMRNLIREDIEAGRGIGLLDPHGDLADEVLSLIPDSRRSDVVLFDPADEESPVGFNVLGAKSEREKELLASDLVAVFRRFSTSWGDQMTAVLGNAILAFLEHPEGGTLIDLRRFLIERSFRDRYLARIADPAVRSFWVREFPLLKGMPQASILTRLDQFLRTRALRRVVVQRRSKLDLVSLVEQGGIFIGKLSQGAIGEENAHLLGSLIVAKLQQVALARERTPEAERRDFFLYLDEFHHFVTPSLTSLLAGARKYHLGLVLAHQELRQLRDRELESAILTNAGTRVCFRLGDEDARKLAEGFTAFGASDLQSLGTGEAICRVERADQDFTIRVRAPQALIAQESVPRASAIREISRARWGTPREEVDHALREAYGEAALAPDAEFASPNRKEVQPNGIERAAVIDAPLRPAEQALRAPKSESIRKVRRTPRPTGEAPQPGRGGAKHKYLQSLIKHYAEERGYRATIEAAVVGGGRVDVLLERDGERIACEISVTSTASQEVGNIAKCIRGDFQRIVVVSPERKLLRRVSAEIGGAVSEPDRARVSFLTPDELLALLDDGGSGAPSEREAKVLGYRVKTTVRALPREDREARHASVVQTIVKGLRRMKDKP